MKQLITETVLLAVLSLVSFASTSLGAPTYSFNFTGGVGNNVKYLTNAPSDAAGVVGATNWNNLIATGNNASAFTASANKTWTGLKNDAGLANTVTLTISNVAAAGTLTSTDTNCPGGRLYYNFWKGSTGGTQTNDTGLTCTVSNLTVGAIYDVYVYLANDSNDGNGNGDWGHVNVNGGTRYYFNVNINSTSTGFSCTNGYHTFVQTNSAGAYSSVNYIEIPAVQVPGNGVLTIIFTAESAKAYSVAGVQLRAPLTVSVATQPANQSVYTNGVVLFSVTAANGVVPYAYQWYKVSGGATNVISDATNNSYSTPPATLADSGTKYFVIITDALANMAVSAQAALSVVTGSANVISVQLMPDHWSDVGTVPVAPAEKTGASPRTNWNAVTVDFPGDYQNYYTQTYGLADVLGIGGVELIVQGVSDGWHDNSPPPDSAPITKLLNTFVKVSTPATPGNNTLGLGLMQFTFTNLAGGQTYNAYVYTEGDGSGEEANIYVAGTGVTNYATELFSVNSNTVFTPSLNTDPSATPDAGNYVHLLNLTPVGGAITISAEVGGTAAIGVSGLQLVKSSVDLVAASITKQPVSQTVLTNAQVPYSVAALGFPLPTYQWYVISGALTNAIVNATNSTYTTPPATVAMNGNRYYCVVSNTLPSVAASSQATQTVVAATWDAISVQFEPSGNYGIDAYVQALAATNTTGAFSVSNWDGRVVSINGSALAPQNYSLLKERNHGYGSPVQLTVLGVSDGYGTLDTNGNLFIPDSAPITKLLNTWVEAPPSTTSGRNTDTGVGQYIFSNLDNTLTYDVYVYLIGDNYGGPNLYADVDAGTAVTHYTGPLFLHVNASSNFVESINTDANGIRDSGNFVHLDNIAPTSGAITVSVAYDPLGNGYSVGVCGLQLVKSSADLYGITLLQSPISQRVLTNTTAVLGVAATGNPINYQWHRVSGGVTNLLANATNRAYTTPPVTDAMTGTGYFVVLSNQFNRVTSATAILTAGHLVSPVVGFLENDQFNTGTFTTALNALTSLYPGSPYLTNNTPDTIEYLTTFNDNADLADNSAERIYGWFTPNVTGNYVFYVASDDAGALWLSTNSNPANAYQIAQNRLWMTCGNDGPTDWLLSDTGSAEYANLASGEWRSDLFEQGGGQNAYAGFIAGWSAWPTLNGDGSIPLVAGTHYFIEFDHQEGGGGQGAAVTYKLAGQPDPSAGAASLLTAGQLSTLQTLDGNVIVITNQPQNITVASGATAAFSVVAGSYVAGSSAAPAPTLEYQWQQKGPGGGSFTNIPGAADSIYTTSTLSSSDSGTQFRVVLTVPGVQTNSAAATATVTAASPPVLSITRSGTNVVITWSPPGGTLWSSPAIGPSASWTSLGGSQPYTTPASSSKTFFRVIVP